MSQPVLTVRALYDAFARQETNTIRQILDPPIEWIQMDGFPMGGHHHGVEAVLTEVFATFRKHWSDWAAVPDSYLEAGEVVIVLGHYVGTGKRTGKSIRAAFAHLYTVHDDRIIKFVQYTDTLRVAEAL